MDDLTSDLALFGVRVGGDGEGWSVGGSFVWSGGDFGRGCRRGCVVDGVDKGDGRGHELWARVLAVMEDML